MYCRRYLFPRDVLEAMGPPGAVGYQPGQAQHLRLELGQQVRPAYNLLLEGGGHFHTLLIHYTLVKEGGGDRRGRGSNEDIEKKSLICRRLQAITCALIALSSLQHKKYLFIYRYMYK